MPKPPASGERMKPKNPAEKPAGRGAKLFRYGLIFSLIGSLLIMVEGIRLILFPLPYQIPLLADWGGYFDLIFSLLALVGLLGVAYAHTHKKIKTMSAAAIGLLSILSLILFGGGFYLGFILGLTGALLTASRE